MKPFSIEAIKDWNASLKLFPTVWLSDERGYNAQARWEKMTTVLQTQGDKLEEFFEPIIEKIRNKLGSSKSDYAFLTADDFIEPDKIGSALVLVYKPTLKYVDTYRKTKQGGRTTFKRASYPPKDGIVFNYYPRDASNTLGAGKIEIEALVATRWENGNRKEDYMLPYSLPLVDWSRSAWQNQDIYNTWGKHYTKSINIKRGSAIHELFKSNEKISLNTVVSRFFDATLAMNKKAKKKSASKLRKQIDIEMDQKMRQFNFPGLFEMDDMIDALYIRLQKGEDVKLDIKNAKEYRQNVLNEFFEFEDEQEELLEAARESGDFSELRAYEQQVKSLRKKKRNPRSKKGLLVAGLLLWGMTQLK